MFGAAKPGAVIVTTPNSEYNVLYEGLVGHASPRPPLRVDPRTSSPDWSDRVAADLRLRASSAAASATSTTPSAPRPRWRSSPGRRDRCLTQQPTSSRSPFPPWAWSSWSASPAAASPRSRAATSSRPRSSPATSAAASSPTTRTTSPPRRTPSTSSTTSSAPGCAAGLLTVVDATNVQQAARASLVKLAKSHDVLVDAIVLDVPESVAIERNQQRPDRDFGDHVVTRQHRDLKRSFRRLSKEGLPSRPRPARHRPGRGRRDRARAAVERPQGDPRPLRHHRRRPRLRLGAAHPAHRARLDDRVRR